LRFGRCCVSINCRKRCGGDKRCAEKKKNRKVKLGYFVRAEETDL